MCPAGGDATPGGGRSRPVGRVALGSLCLLVLAAGLVLVVGSAGATLPATSPQQSANATTVSLSEFTAVDATTMEFVVGSDAGVAAESIDAADFQVAPGEVDSVSASASGSDATVTLELASPVDSDAVAVGFTGDATVTDGNGTALDTVGVSGEVDGMDGVAPRVETFTVANESGTTVRVDLAATEAVNATTVTLDGPATVRLDRGNFTASDDGTDLTATATLPMAGDYRATVDTLVDDHGNARESGRVATVETTERPPTAVAGLDFGATNGSVVTLDATRSTAVDAIDSFTWDLGDGSEASGARVTHRYRPGTYTATVTVTDADGDVGTDTVVVTVGGAGTSADTIPSSATVDLQANASTPASAIVDVADPADGPVRVARANATADPLAASDGLALEALTVELSTPATYGLAIQTEGPSAVGDVRNATEGAVVGGLTVVHDVGDDAVANVTLTVAVEPDSLAALDAGPENVTLFRHHGGNWTALNTTRVDDAEDGRYRFEADSPGLSRFAVATAPGAGGAEDNATANATPTATPTPTETQASSGDESDSTSSVTVRNATANRTAVDPGQPVAVAATVTNDGSGVAGFTAALSVNGTVVDSQPLTVPGGENRTASLTYVPNATGTYPLVVNGTSAGTLTVGSGGGILASLLGIVDLLPLGLFQTLLTYLGGVLVAVFLALKSLALFMGY